MQQQQPAEPSRPRADGHVADGHAANGLATHDAEASPPVVVHKLPTGEVVRAGLTLMALVVGLYLLWYVQEAIFLLFLAILLATAIEPIVNRLRRGPFSRGSGVLVVYTVIVLLLGLIGLAVVPSLAAQASSFADTIPAKLEQARPLAEQLRPESLRNTAVGVLNRVNEGIRTPAPPPETAELVELGATAGHYLLSFFSVFVLAFYWLVERASIKRALLRMVTPRRAKYVNTVWVEVEEKLGGWVRGQLLVMSIMGVVASVGFFFIGLPSPILLGVIVALGEAVPLVGPFLGFAPAVIVAFVVEPYLALVTLVFALVAQQIEGNFLLPRIMGHTVGVSPLTVMMGLLVGSIVAGLPGAFLAIPIAGAIQVILAHSLRMEDPIQQDAHQPGAPQAAAQGATNPDRPIFQQVP